LPKEQIALSVDPSIEYNQICFHITLKHDQQGNMKKSVTFGSYEDIIHWDTTLIADKK